MASTLTLALRGGGLPAGAWSKAAASVGGTSNGIVGSTVNGKRSHSSCAGAGDQAFPQLQLTEDQTAAAGAAPLEAQGDARGPEARGR